MRMLADRLACERSYITGLADQLEERGLVTRATGEDRRVKLLALTESDRAPPIAGPSESAFLASVGIGDADVLSRGVLGDTLRSALPAEA
jgi:hypothetical protein